MGAGQGCALEAPGWLRWRLADVWDARPVRRPVGSADGAGVRTGMKADVQAADKGALATEIERARGDHRALGRLVTLEDVRAALSGSAGTRRTRRQVGRRCSGS